MKKIFLSIIILLIIVPLKINAFTFIKEDEEGNYINDAEFRVRSLDGSITYNVRRKSELDNQGFRSPTPMSVKKMDTESGLIPGQYLISNEYYEGNETTEFYNKLLNILGPEERQIVEDLKDYSKYQYYRNILDASYSSDYERLVATRGIILNDDNVCPNATTPTPNSNLIAENEELGCTRVYVTVPVLMVLEETKAPIGLKKEKAIIEYYYVIEYSFNNNYENRFVRVERVSAEISGLFVKYNYDLDYSNILGLETKRQSITNDEELYYKTDCGNYFMPVVQSMTAPTPTNSLKNYSTKKMEMDSCYDYPVLIDYKSDVRLVISSYVNNGGSTRAEKGSKVDYKIVVRNEGTASSSNNIITSKIPYGFEYVDGSASDSGEYVESLNAIRWNVSEISAESEKELTYKVSVSEDVDLTQSYISSATISSDDVEEMESNETMVTLQGEIENPKTGDARNVLILFALSVAGLIGYYFLDNKVFKGL